MLLQIEFFRRSNENSDGEPLRRRSGQFANERGAETYGRMRRPESADGFRIQKDGMVRKTVLIRTET